MVREAKVTNPSQHTTTTRKGKAVTLKCDLISKTESDFQQEEFGWERRDMCYRLCIE